MTKGIYGCVCASLILSSPWIRCRFSSASEEMLPHLWEKVTILRLGNRGKYIEEKDIEPESEENQTIS